MLNLQDGEVYIIYYIGVKDSLPTGEYTETSTKTILLSVSILGV